MDAIRESESRAGEIAPKMLVAYKRRKPQMKARERACRITALEIDDVRLRQISTASLVC